MGKCTGDRGIDDDLRSCLRYNPQPFDEDDIDLVIATIEGENDGPEWWWLLLLRDGRPALLTGACDYTGWDCQSWAASAVASAPYGPFYFQPACDSYDEAHPTEPVPPEVIRELARQEQSGRKPTKRTEVGRALFGTQDGEGDER